MYASPKPLSRTGAWCARVAVAAVALAVAWFYVWTANPEGLKPWVSREGGGYFNLLARGFLKGQLSLDLAADPALATLKNPYDSVERAGRGLHDASYFKGKYYLYFGATPVAVLFAPFRLLTGRFIAEWAAVVVFALAGFGFSVGLLRAIRRRCFDRAPAWVTVAGVLALGTATMVPALLRRPDVWEVPIACAYALVMLTFWLVWRALTGPHPARWLALASLTMGLTVGARPTYLPGAVVLLAPLAATWAQRRERAWVRLAAAALLPIAAVGAGLAAYNQLRFGSITEFGWTYQMAGDDNSSGKMLSGAMVGFNLRLYLLSAAGLSPFFPYVTVITPPPVPPGQLGMENPYGLLPNMPWVLLAAGAAWLVVAARTERALRWFCAGALGASAATLLMVCCFRGAAGRYLVDFAPGFALLAGVGAYWAATSGPGPWRVAASFAVAGLAAWSAAFGVFVSLQHNDLLRAEHPAVYARVAGAFNRAAWRVQGRTAADVGPVELRVIFPRGAAGKVEPLVVTGREFRADYLYVNYFADDLLQFGFEHTSYGGPVGEPVKITPGAPYTVTVAMGSLYPPRAHPYYDGLDGVEAGRRAFGLRVTLDGKVALQRVARFYDAAEWTPSIGTSAGRPGFKRDFSGQVLGWKRLGETARSPTDAAPAPGGVLRLRLRFPAFTGARSEPLLSTGVGGKGDLVYVRYEDAGHVRFAHDQWSVGGTTGAPVAVDYGAEQRIEIACPPLLGAGAPPGLVVTLNGEVALRAADAFHPAAPDTVAAARNEIGASSAAVAFSGELIAVERGPAPGPAK